MSIKIKTAGKTDIQTIKDIALKTWEATYIPIVGKEQVDFMLSVLYSVDSLQKQMDERQEFILLYSDEVPAGFISFNHQTESRYRIPKLYVDPDLHGKGLGKLLLHEVFKRVKEKGGDIVELNVNRHNKAKGFYEKFGFKVNREEDIPIGKYWMNDYVMEREL